MTSLSPRPICGDSRSDVATPPDAIESALASHTGKYVDGVLAREVDQACGDVGVEQVYALPLTGNVYGLFQVTELDRTGLRGHFAFILRNSNKHNATVIMALRI